MAYRSDVNIILKKNDFEFLKDFVKSKTKEDEYNLMEHLDEYQELDFDEISFGWISIKWYDYDPEYFPEIQNVINGLEEIKKLDHPYQFARVGEEYGDDEVINILGDYDLNNYLGIRREIEIY